MSQHPKPTIAILSIGQMGLGIASLLQAYNYRITTNASDRSAATQQRALSAGIVLIESDAELIAGADYVLSIVPPRDAVATAKRIENALKNADREKDLWYLDLNAIAPATAKAIDASFAANAPRVQFVDGGIIGGPPAPAPSSAAPADWTRPGIPLSGPHALHKHNPDLAAVLNTRYVGAEIGTASGLKCCFAAMSKGFAALAIQSFTTASTLGVLGPLKDYMDMYTPGTKEKAEKSIVGCTGKAYRWVEEMNQIGQCFAEEGSFRETAMVFRQVASVFEELAGAVEKRGTEGMGSAEGVVGVLGEELKKTAGN